MVSVDDLHGRLEFADDRPGGLGAQARMQGDSHDVSVLWVVSYSDKHPIFAE
jgi:hypothetical protein